MHAVTAPPSGTTLYDLLGVREDATYEEIRDARRRLAKIYHPSGGLNPDEEVMKAVNNAADILLDAEKRRRYDAEIDVAAERDASDATTPEEGPGEVAVVDPKDHYQPEPLVPGLIKVLAGLARTGMEQVPELLRRAPRVALTVGGLIAGAIISSFMIRACSGAIYEQELEDDLPAAVARDCRGGVDLPDRARAAIRCTPGGLATDFVQFRTLEGLDDYFDSQSERLANRGVIKEGPSGSCATPGFVASYSAAGSEAGRVACFVEGSRPHFVWTDEASLIYASGDGGQNYSKAYRWWIDEAGPAGTLDRPQRKDG